MFEVATGKLPFYDKNYNKLAKMINQNMYKRDLVQTKLSQVIEMCLANDPVKRATVKQIKQHPYWKSEEVVPVLRS